MSDKLYTEEQVQALIAAAYATSIEAIDRKWWAVNHQAVLVEAISYINECTPANAKTKLREMMMEVAIKTSIRIVGEFRTDSAIAKSLNIIVNEVLGETS